jgi:hypothetical protein
MGFKSHRANCRGADSLAPGVTEPTTKGTVFRLYLPYLTPEHPILYPFTLIGENRNAELTALPRIVQGRFAQILTCHFSSTAFWPV